MTTWTAETVKALGVTMDGVLACRIVYGAGRTKSYELLRHGNVDFPVLRCGRKYVVPTSAVLALLGLDEAA